MEGEERPREGRERREEGRRVGVEIERRRGAGLSKTSAEWKMLADFLLFSCFSLPSLFLVASSLLLLSLGEFLRNGIICPSLTFLFTHCDPPPLPSIYVDVSSTTAGRMVHSSPGGQLAVEYGLIC